MIVQVSDLGKYFVDISSSYHLSDISEAGNIKDKNLEIWSWASKFKEEVYIWIYALSSKFLLKWSECACSTNAIDEQK